MRDVIAVDVETDSLEARYDKNKQAWSLGFAWFEGDEIVKKALPWQAGIRWLKRRTRQSPCTLVFHRAAFDIAVIETHSDFVVQNYDDTKLMMYCLNPGEDNGLQDLGYLVGVEKMESPSFDKLTNEMLEYNAQDAAVCLAGYAYLRPQIDADAKLKEWYYHVELPFVRVIIEMERTGFFIDGEAINKARDAAAAQHDTLKTELTDMGGLCPGKSSKTKLPRKPEQVSQTPEEGKWCLVKEDEEGLYHWKLWEKFNPNSSAHVAFALQQHGWKPEKTTDSGKIATDAATLERVSLPLAQVLLSFREVDKILGTYLTPFIERTENGVLHGQFNQTVTATGRLSSSNP